MRWWFAFLLCSYTLPFENKKQKYFSFFRLIQIRSGGIITPLRVYQEFLLHPSLENSLSHGFVLAYPESSISSVTSSTSKKVGSLFRRKHPIDLKAWIHLPKTLDSESSLGVWVAGGKGFVGVEIKNDSRNKVRNFLFPFSLLKKENPNLC